MSSHVHQRIDKRERELVCIIASIKLTVLSGILFFFAGRKSEPPLIQFSIARAQLSSSSCSTQEARALAYAGKRARGICIGYYYKLLFLEVEMVHMYIWFGLDSKPVEDKKSPRERDKLKMGWSQTALLYVFWVFTILFWVLPF